MKKPTLVLLVVTQLILLMACGGGGSSSNPDNDAVDSVQDVSGANPSEGSNAEPADDDTAAPEPEPEPEPTNSIEISVQINGFGEVTPSSLTLESGQSGTFSISPAESQYIASVSGCPGVMVNESYVLDPVSENCTVVVDFGEDYSSPELQLRFPMKSAIWTNYTYAINGYLNEAQVSGTATDNVEILSVRVDGQEVDIDVVDAEGEYAGQPTSKVVWSTVVPVPRGSSKSIVVEAEDIAGNIAKLSPDLVLRDAARESIPWNAFIDPVSNSLLGWNARDHIFSIYSLFSDDYDSLLTDYYRCSHGVYSMRIGGNYCAYKSEGAVNIDTVSFAGAIEGVLYGSLSPDFNVLEWGEFTINDIVISDSESYLYILLQLHSVKGSHYDERVIYSYDLQSHNFEIIYDERNHTFDIGGFIAYSDQGLLALRGVRSTTEILYRISLKEGLPEPVSTIPGLKFRSIDRAPGDNYAYLSGSKGFLRVDLQSGAHWLMSTEENEEVFNIGAISAVSIDPAGERLLISDSSYDYVMSVDTTTGQRGEFAAVGLGEGRRMVSPSAVLLNTDESHVYILDSAFLLKANLATGDREVLYKFSPECGMSAADLTLDKENQLLYVIFTEAVYEYNLVTDTARLILDFIPDCERAGVAFLGAAFDPQRGRLLITDIKNGVVLSVDVVSGESATVVENPQEAYRPIDIEINDEIAYILDYGNERFLTLDLLNNELATINSYCFNANGGNVLDSDVGNIRRMKFDKHTRSIWLTGVGVARYHLDDGVCQYSYVDNNSQPYFHDIEVTSNGQLLITGRNELMQLDFNSLQMFTLAK